MKTKHQNHSPATNPQNELSNSVSSGQNIQEKTNVSEDFKAGLKEGKKQRVELCILMAWIVIIWIVILCLLKILIAII